MPKVRRMVSSLAWLCIYLTLCRCSRVQQAPLHGPQCRGSLGVQWLGRKQWRSQLVATLACDVCQQDPRECANLQQYQLLRRQMSVWRQGGDEAYIRIWGPIPPVSSRSMRPTLQIDCCVLQQHSVTGNSDVELYRGWAIIRKSNYKKVWDLAKMIIRN